MHIETTNDKELTQVMADAILRVGEGCTETDLREWFTPKEIARCGTAAVARAHEASIENRRARNPIVRYANLQAAE
ncbi:hypothetical protein [Agrobacterium tumefaciens]|uniref:hypothetical protein n=1 Tax=Agrobacterium tumefaciens TaxID=358 RepID=UPI000472E045